MWHYDPALDKCWVTQSGYFRLAAAVLLVMGKTYSKLLFCHGISDQIRDKKIPMIYYKIRMVYEFSNNTFLGDCGMSGFSIPSMPLYDISRPNKRAHSTPDLLTAAIYFPSGKYVITLNTTYESPNFNLLTSDTNNTHYGIMIEDPGRVRGGNRYYSRLHDGIICYKKRVYIALHVLLTKLFISIVDLP